MIPAGIPSLPVADLVTSAPQTAANPAATAANGEQFAKALDKASAPNEPKSIAKEAKSSKGDAQPKSTDEPTMKSEDTAADESAPKAEEVAEATTEVAAAPTEPTAPIVVKPLEVSAFAQLLPTATAETTPVVDPALTAQLATTVTVAAETAPAPAAPVLVVATAAPADVAIAEATKTATVQAPIVDAPVAAAPVVATPVVDAPVAETADPAAALPTATAPEVEHTETRAAALPTAAPVATEAPKEAPKQAAPAADVSVANAFSIKTQAVEQTAVVTAAKAVAVQHNPEPYRQVMQVVQPLRGRDGDHSITISLMPENLGRVDVQINISAGNNVNMQMNADNPQSRQLLRDSLNDLRNSLNESGLNAGSLDVGSQSAGQQSQQSGRSNGANAWNNAGDLEITDEEFFARLAATGSTPVGDGPLDVRA